MQEELDKLKAVFPKLKTEMIEQKFIFKNEIEIEKRILLSGLSGNEELVLILRDEEETTKALGLPLQDVYLFKEFLGLYQNNKIEVLLTEISLGSFVTSRRIEKSPVEININYRKSELKVRIEYNEDEEALKFIASHIRGSITRGRYRRALILTIENLSNIKLEDLESEVKLILNSVLFDIEYNFSLSFETININSLQRKLWRKPKPRYELPIEAINLTYKKYLPELIDYFHTGEKVDYIPFKFICYFHIVEYFQDKSAFFIVREKLKNIMLKPDFSLNVNLYATQALNLIKQESEKNQTDKIKIQRVLKQFLDVDEFKQFLVNEELLDYFSKDLTMVFTKNLILPAIDFTSDTKFIETLTNRIYSIRCSIVHSNPDFDDKKAVPFLATLENIDKLRYEVELIMEVAKTIIIRTT
jgi:hypothetical protein